VDSASRPVRVFVAVSHAITTSSGCSALRASVSLRDPRSHQAVYGRIASSQQLVFVAAFPNERQESFPGTSSAQVHCKPLVRDRDDLTGLRIGQADIYPNSVAIPKQSPLAAPRPIFVIWN
jgi:hypothetical protein